MQAGTERSTIPLSHQRSLADFTLLSCIGKGNTATAYLARTTSNQLRVIRAVRKDLTIGNDEVSRVFSQKQILSLPQILHHPFIPTLYLTLQDESHLFFVTEYAAGGDLMYHVQRGALDPSTVQFYAAELFLAISFLHAQHIIHRGISLDNILITRDGHVKLAGFGCSKIASRTHSFVGNAEFMAPEILLDQEYGFGVDWWAFGVVLYQMILRRPPFRGDDEDEIYDSILQDSPVYPSGISDGAKSLIQGLLERNPAQRLGVADEDDIRAHPYFAGINWDALRRQEVEPSLKPSIGGEDDTSNFDPEFTAMKVPDLTVFENNKSHDSSTDEGYTNSAFQEIDQNLFEGF